jgi:hypothetical protein
MESIHPTLKVERITTVDGLQEYAELLDCEKDISIDYALGPALRGGGIVIGLKSESHELVGLSWAYRTSDIYTIYIPYVIISKNYRGKEAISILDNEMMNQAKVDGVKYAFGLASTDNASSNKAMKKMNWVHIGVTDDYYFKGGKTNLYYKNYSNSACDPNELPFLKNISIY